MLGSGGSPVATPLLWWERARARALARGALGVVSDSGSSLAAEFLSASSEAAGCSRLSWIMYPVGLILCRTPYLEFSTSSHCRSQIGGTHCRPIVLSSPRETYTQSMSLEWQNPHAGWPLSQRIFRRRHVWQAGFRRTVPVFGLLFGGGWLSSWWFSDLGDGLSRSGSMSLI